MYRYTANPVASGLLDFLHEDGGREILMEILLVMPVSLSQQ